MSAAKRIGERILAKLTERVEEFDDKVAKVGFFPDASYSDGTPVAYIAAIQEYGSPANGIPPRPFMRQSVQQNREQWIADIRRGVQALVRGDGSADAVLEQVGGAMAADIQTAVADIASPALSDVTVMLRGMRRNDPSLVVSGRTVGEAAQRVADGKTNYGASDKPLIDSGLLLASVTHKVEGES